MLVLGIMSGTSIDGIDYALCEVRSTSVRLVKLWSRNFPTPLQKRLHAAAVGHATSHEVGQLHHDLGRLYAKHAVALNAQPELVGVHGQTIFHNPDRKAPATLQIGESSYLAEALRVPVVSNFRAADIAAGGQGAPIASAFHRVVFGEKGEHVCVNNLGGISNVTSIDWRSGSSPRMQAFDTGPANVLIDLAMRTFTNGRKSYDRDGGFARRGRVEEKLLQAWLRHPFFRKRPPKSTGRELFGEPFWREVEMQSRKRRLAREDVIATLTEFTARSLALNYERHLVTAPRRVVLCGGGARNPALVERIAHALQQIEPETAIVTSDSLGWPAEAIEPSAFALLAYYRIKGAPTDFAGTTGARRAVVCGQVAEGSR
jgi:anhydro-N-acetylmuramic acid kinase